jgi:hypothetical protein
MARTKTGVLITERFLRRSAKDIRKSRKMVRIYHKGKLSSKGERELARLIRLHERRFGKMDPNRRVDARKVVEDAEQTSELFVSMRDVAASIVSLTERHGERSMASLSLRMLQEMKLKAEQYTSRARQLRKNLEQRQKAEVA